MNKKTIIPAQEGFFALTPVFSGPGFGTVTDFTTRPIIGWQCEPDFGCVPLVAHELGMWYVVQYPGIDGCPHYETCTLVNLNSINDVLPWMKSQCVAPVGVERSDA